MDRGTPAHAGCAMSGPQAFRKYAAKAARQSGNLLASSTAGRKLRSP
jgi:hypothetical protein